MAFGGVRLCLRREWFAGGGLNPYEDAVDTFMALFMAPRRLYVDVVVVVVR